MNELSSLNYIYNFFVIFDCVIEYHCLKYGLVLSNLI